MENVLICKHVLLWAFDLVYPGEIIQLLDELRRQYL